MDKFEKIVFVGIVICIILLTVTVYMESYKSAEMYNKINGTDFTTSDFFWASDQINSGSQTIKLK